MERGGAEAVASSTAPQSRVPLGADGRPLDGVVRAELLWKLKHGDGSIYRSDGYWAKVYRLYDTSESTQLFPSQFFFLIFFHFNCRILG